MRILCSFLLATISVLTSANALAAAVDGEPSYNANSNPGFYVWRTSNGDWRARLVGGGSSQQYGGSFESDSSFDSLSNYSLEQSDTVTRNGGVMDVSLQVWGSGQDGVDFGLSGSDLCLRSSNSSARIYLGANRVAANAPVDLTSNGACSTSSPTASADGLYIWKDGSTWNARLESTNASQLFVGSFESQGSISGVSRNNFESTDEATMAGSNTLNVDLRTWPGGWDGVQFSTGSNGVCVRGWNDANETVYMGAVGNAIARQTPLDLTGSGACDGSVTPPTPPPPTAGRRFNPGHYVRLMTYNDARKGMDQANVEGVKGVMKVIPWRELEPSRGNYDFSEIASDLTYLSSQGLQLIVMIQDKTFQQGDDPMPGYLATNQYRSVNHAGGFTAYRWNPTVVEREKALLTAMAQRFNSHSGFEGVSFQESATGISQSQLDQVGYTPEKYRDALIEVLNHAGRSFSSAHAFWYMNFLERKNPYMADVLAATRGNGVVAGGPDVAPDNYSLQTHTYPILRDNIGKMPLFSQVEGLVYAHEHADNSYPTKYWTMTEIFRYARDNLKVNYLFWVLLPAANPPDSHDFYDAVPVIRANPEFN